MPAAQLGAMAMRYSNAMATTLIHFIPTSFDNERMLDSTETPAQSGRAFSSLFEPEPIGDFNGT
jgi:hypothetical protein